MVDSVCEEEECADVLYAGSGVEMDLWSPLLPFHDILAPSLNLILLASQASVLIDSGERKWQLLAQTSRNWVQDSPDRRHPDLCYIS